MSAMNRCASVDASTQQFAGVLGEDEMLMQLSRAIGLKYFNLQVSIDAANGVLLRGGFCMFHRALQHCLVCPINNQDWGCVLCFGLAHHFIATAEHAEYNHEDVHSTGWRRRRVRDVHVTMTVSAVEGGSVNGAVSSGHGELFKAQRERQRQRQRA